MSETIEEVFWKRVIIGESTECWPWRATAGSNGRGAFAGTSAARAAYQFAHGPITGEGTMVLHRCDNPPCCNPSHLFLGSAADNMRDMGAKRRGRGNGFSERTHCNRGHLFDEENTIVTPSGKRRACRTCMRAARKRHVEKRRMEIAAYLEKKAAALP